MEKFAIVKFIGNEENYVSGEICNEWLYCIDCEKHAACSKSKFNYFKKNKEYKAYFLDYCQGQRDVLEVAAENGEILTYVPLADFEIVADEDNVLKDTYIMVKCIKATREDLTLNKKYKALKTDKANKCYYVLDNFWDCYYYPKDLFQVYP